MNIAIYISNADNIGGILNHTEHLTAAFQELGHTVYHFSTGKRTVRKEETMRVLLATTGKDPRPKVATTVLTDDDAVAMVNNACDALVIAVRFPPANLKKLQPEELWAALYPKWMCGVDVPVLNMIHDTNQQGRHAHGLLAVPTVYAPVLGDAHTIAAGLPIPVTASPVPSPHVIPPLTTVQARRRAAAGQYDPCAIFLPAWFKGWKHIDEILRAAPFMTKAKILLAGGGIERCYMTTQNPEVVEKNRGKINKYTWCDGDPDITPALRGKRIWDAAIESGNVRYMGFLKEEQVNEVYYGVNFCLDPGYAPYRFGSTTRLLADGLARYVIPIGRHEFIGSRKPGEAYTLPYKTVLKLDIELTPRQIAARLDYIVGRSRAHYAEMLKSNFEFAKRTFDSHAIAQRYINLLTGQEKPVMGGTEFLDGAITAMLRKGVPRGWVKQWLEDRIDAGYAI